MLVEFAQLPEVFSDTDALEKWLQGFHNNTFDPEDAIVDVLYAGFENEDHFQINPLDRPKILDLVIRPNGQCNINVSFIVIGIKDAQKLEKKYDTVKIKLNRNEFGDVEKIVSETINKSKKHGFEYPEDIGSGIKISCQVENGTYHITISNELVIKKTDYAKNLYAVKITAKAQTFYSFPSNLYLLSYKYTDSTFAKSRYASYNMSERDGQKIIETTRLPVFKDKRYVSIEFEFKFDYKSLSDCSVEKLKEFYVELARGVDVQIRLLEELHEAKMRKDPNHSKRIRTEFECDTKRLKSELKNVENGIKILSENDTALKSFRILNKIFALRYDIESERNPEYKNNSWRSFQLAFLLSEIPSIFKNEKTLALLNFPTGMGKTEAFMGLALLKIINERLAMTNHGTSAIIKYPRKLLSRQQLKRAFSLVAFANAVLLEDADVLSHPISLGTLFNSEDTPNRYVDAEKGYRQTTKEFQDWKRDPYGRAIRIEQCPYCNSEIKIDADDANLRIKFMCANKNCIFVKDKADHFFERTEGELPLYIGDDEVFRYLPSILITTIDKFSTFSSNNPNFKSLLLDKRVKLDSKYGFYFTNKHFKHFQTSISGKETEWEEYSKKFKSPSLFIFDEIHLVNGAYASKLSVIENAFMNLFANSFGGQKPHIICSSATICQKFNDDGFFSYQLDMNRMFNLSSPEKVILYPAFWELFVKQKQEPRRTIVAIMPCTYSHYLAIEHVSWYYFNKFGQIPEAYKRYYSTFLYYFKAKARLERVRGSLRERVIEKKGDPVRTNFEDDMEFSTDVQQPKMEKDQAKIEGRTKITSKQKTLMVFATNTIANGLDIEAFNTMFIFGFPNRISEYIQARSRISRKDNAGFCAFFLSQKNYRETSVFYDFHNLHENINLAIEATTINREAEGVIESMIKKLFHLALQTTYDSETDPFYNRKTIKNVTESSEKLGKLKDIVYEWFDFENPSRDIARKIFDEKWANYIGSYKKWLEYTTNPTIYSDTNPCLPQPSLLDISTPIEIKLTQEGVATAINMARTPAPLYTEEPNETGDDELTDIDVVGKERQNR